MASDYEITLWRSRPPLSATTQHATPMGDLRRVFPSARQALTQSLRELGFGRKDRIALPLFSSHCVVSAVSRVMTPVSVKDIASHEISAEAVLIYEQWGWRYSDRVLENIKERFPVIIFDCVDSPDILTERCHLHSKGDAVNLVSLSKCLGLKGGGFVRLNKKDLMFTPEPGAEAFDTYLAALGPDLVKTYARTRQHLVDTIHDINIEACLRDEAAKRRENAHVALQSDLSKSWPEWMKLSLESGSAPGILPLFRGMSQDRLQHIQSLVRSQLKIETAVYNFNWSGHPLEDGYEPCLAFPNHGNINMATVRKNFSLWKVI